MGVGFPVPDIDNALFVLQYILVSDQCFRQRYSLNSCLSFFFLPCYYNTPIELDLHFLQRSDLGIGLYDVVDVVGLSSSWPNRRRLPCKGVCITALPDSTPLIL